MNFQKKNSQFCKYHITSNTSCSFLYFPFTRRQFFCYHLNDVRFLFCAQVSLSISIKYILNYVKLIRCVSVNSGVFAVCFLYSSSSKWIVITDERINNFDSTETNYTSVLSDSHVSVFGFDSLQFADSVVVFSLVLNFFFLFVSFCAKIRMLVFIIILFRTFFDVFFLYIRGHMCH